MRKLLPAGLCAALAAACQTGWVRPDGAAVDAARLDRAQQDCRVEQKLAALERAREARGRQLGQAGSNQASMLAREDYAAIERQLQGEIDACMRLQGYTRKG